mmetsp:Transcript_21935/g.55828  ORF Transcript_21935/g.55828 Transcript_21935/m.55828 type:complete len:211 (+) Transcript_21935:611-1243(+)
MVAIKRKVIPETVAHLAVEVAQAPNRGRVIRLATSASLDVPFGRALARRLCSLLGCRRRGRRRCLGALDARSGRGHFEDTDGEIGGGAAAPDLLRSLDDAAAHGASRPRLAAPRHALLRQSLPGADRRRRRRLGDGALAAERQEELHGTAGVRFVRGPLARERPRLVPRRLRLGAARYYVIDVRSCHRLDGRRVGLSINVRCRPWPGSCS